MHDADGAGMHRAGGVPQDSARLKSGLTFETGEFQATYLLACLIGR